MTDLLTPKRPATDEKPGRFTKRGRDGLAALGVRIIGLGLAIAVAISVTPALVGDSSWFFLAAIWAIVAVLVAVYATGRALPAKYLLPGTLMLVLFVVYPILLTAKTSFTNYGDGTRGTKEDTISQITGASVTRSESSPQYNLTIATDGDPASGPFTFFLVPQDDPESAFEGTAEGLEEAGDGVTIDNGRVSAVDGYTILNIKQISAASEALDEIANPTEGGNFIVRDGTSEAFEGAPTLQYDEDADTITDTTTGTVYSVELRGDREFCVDENGERISDQSWTANVGTLNYKEIFTDSRISSDFLRIFAWTFIFATVSVVSTFLLGLLFALTLNDPRVRGQKIYRALLILPYAIPGFISLLLWSSFYNQDFGLINEITGLNINWFGGALSAKVAVLLTNLWMGFPYMFLVTTGALQAIPEDLTEAARIDGASGFEGFRRITFPLLLVTVAPLLVATFAFNFNNFGAIYLLTGGGPFTPDNPTAGGTDSLISYTYRLAFGAGGVQIGFAAAVSVILFVITGVIAALPFRATRSLEDVN